MCSIMGYKGTGITKDEFLKMMDDLIDNLKNLDEWYFSDIGLFLIYFNIIRLSLYKSNKKVKFCKKQYELV